MASSEAVKARLRITRAGLVTPMGAGQHLARATRYAPHAWGFPDGSALIYRNLHETQRVGRAAQQISRRSWAAYNLD